MGKKIVLAIAMSLMLSGCSIVQTDYGVLPDPDQTLQPTETPLATEPPSTQPEEVAFWPDGLKIQDVTDSTNQNCTFDMCVFLKLTALKTCSSITLYGTTYTEDDDEVDSFDADFSKLKKGKSRIVEFGTDASDDTEDYVELDESTCWK